MSTDRPESIAPAPRRRRRGFWITFAISILLPLALIASAPWLLNTTAGNRFLRGHLARAFAPGRLHVGAIRISWIGPTRLTDIALDDPSGKRVVTAPSGSLESSLWRLVTRPGRPGTLALDSAAFQVARRPDGSLDLAEALAGVFDSPDPVRELSIQADRATLRVDGPALVEPVVADAMDLLVRLRPSPEPVTWSAALSRRDGPTLKVTGELDRWRARTTSEDVPDIDVNVEADRWPIAVRVGGADVSGRFAGLASAHRSGGLWRSEGRLAAERLAVAGKSVGEAIDLAGSSASWSVARVGGGWSIERFEAATPFAHLAGTVPVLTDADHPARVEGRVDLPALATWKATGLPDGTRIESGSVRIVAVSGAKGNRAEWSMTASLDGLAWSDKDGPHRQESPLALAGTATYRPDGARLDVAALALRSRYLTVRADGGVSGLDGPVTLDLSGTVEPAWDDISRLLAERVEPGAKVVGGPSRFSVRGPIASVDAELALQLIEADVFGMRLGPAPIVARYRSGRPSLEPIETTLNQGRLRLEPEIDLDAKGGPVVRLGKGSVLTDAQVNAEVSRRVLSFVAPVLDRTTAVSGRVSASIDAATFPVGGDPSRRANVTGSIVFKEVEFDPSPLARQVVGLVMTNEPGPLRLDQPVNLTIADGRVTQHGLALPIGDVTSVSLDGWVDFDKNLGLVATLPVTSAMLGDRPILGGIAAGTNVRVPIGGTLDHPKLDKEAFRAELGDLLKELAVRGAGVGALELLNRLARPRDPNAPPPPTAEERRAMRRERQNERRKARGLPPKPEPDDRP